MIAKAFSDLEVEFVTWKPTLSKVRPCGLCVNVKRVNGRNSEWAFLQSYEEVDENVNTNILTIDNERGNQYSVPFYSASQLSPWSGRYTDPPLDNIPAGGSLCYL